MIIKIEFDLYRDEEYDEPTEADIEYAIKRQLSGYDNSIHGSFKVKRVFNLEKNNG